jgi:hypothetical protein
MSGAEVEELRALRRRAYGPGADIHLDSDALARLQQLEGELNPQQPAGGAVEEQPADPAMVEQEHPEPDVETEHPARRWMRRLVGVRRSSWLILLGVGAMTAIVITALTLIQRVQTDPLQVGARQVARLSLDPGYEIPGFFGSPSLTDNNSEAYQEFYGLRAVVTDGGFFTSAGAAECLTIYAEENVEDSDSNSFAGALYGGCEAGAFPAVAQFTVDGEGLPEELVRAFPGSVGLQFVYDSVNREVVVFADR